MSKGLFNLENFDKMGENDVLAMNINEEAEFAHKNPDTNHPEEHFDKDATGAKETSIPVPGGDSETPKAKPYDAASVTIPGGDSETPKAKPYDVKSIPVPNKVTLTTDQYDAALSALKKSFKEGYEIMEMLEQANVVQKSVDDMQDEYTENVLFESLLAAYEDGPIFEAVTRDDKKVVKEVVRKIRPKIESALTELVDGKVKFYKANVVLGTITALLAAGAATTASLGGGIILGSGLIAKSVATAVAGGAVIGASMAASEESGKVISRNFKTFWNNKLWQVLGVTHFEESNISKVVDALNEKLKDDLEGYKILYVKTSPVLADNFATKWGWKNNKNTYFLIVDKSIPKDLVEFNKSVEEAEAKAEKSEDKKED